MNVEKARQALEDMDDYARMANINPAGPYHVLEKFINEVEEWVNDALEMHPKLDLAIEVLRNIRKVRNG